MIASSVHDHLRRRRWSSIIGLTLVVVVSLTACSGHATPVDDVEVASAWMENVQDRWADQPGELGAGAGTNDASSRLSLGVADGGERAHVRVSLACQGHGTVRMAVWGGRIADGADTGRELAARSVRCGHDEDLYVVTSADSITIGPTAGDSAVSWYAAAYADLAAQTH
ncbi:MULTISPECIES: hypothetical protein [unclassified Curtobacterium]|uniref:hypothetical protein n=1 Tax=unclassified Curtobacterium TaxID=257496 RepID=UPI0010517C9C|nr:MULTISPECIES: hypothetical protein [unclassified Curtobacterium]